MRFSFLFSLSVALGLFVSCGGHGDKDQKANQLSKRAIGSVEGVVTQNSQGQFQVGNLKLNTAKAKLTIDGKQRDIRHLQPGMTLKAKGNAGTNSSSFDAEDIDVNTIIKGQIEAIGISSRTLIVYGIIVSANDETIIVQSNEDETEFESIDFGDMREGDPLHIWGITQEDGTILATRICRLHESAELDPSFITKGIVSALDSQAKTFRCGIYTVNYAQAEVTGELKNGAGVQVRGTVTERIYLTAESVLVTSDGNGGDEDEGENVYVRGCVRDLNQSASTFTLRGCGSCGSTSYLVDYSEAQVDVALGTVCCVYVEGEVTQNGSTKKIKASKITRQTGMW
jgi:hypothetical protein